MGRETISQRLGDHVWVVWVGRQLFRDWGTTSGFYGKGDDLSETGEPSLGFVGRGMICQRLGDQLFDGECLRDDFPRVGEEVWLFYVCRNG